MQSRFLRALALAVLLLSFSETLLLHWALLAMRGHGPAGWQWPAGLVGVFALNVLVYPLSRRSVRATGLRLVLARGWIMASIAALLTGLVLAAAFAVVGAVTALPALADVRTQAFIWCGGIVIATCFGATFWGATVGNVRVRVDEIPVRLEGLRSAGRPVSIVQITDVHIGPLLSMERLAGFVRRINALEPDLIVITGDIFDFDPAYVEDGCRALAKLEARHGVYAVLGNHDHYTGLDVVVRGLQDLTPIRLLRDEWESVALDQGRVVIAGLEDPGSSWMERDSESPELERLASELRDGLPCILLAHRPSFFRHAERLGFSLVLSGHTHGGQVALPFAKNFNASRMIAHETRGLFQAGGSTLYVSRGIGMAGLPLRINCPREIALLQLGG